MAGWVKLYRKTLDNPIICKDSSYFAVWGYLLLSATHKEYEAMFKGERITLKGGQLITGRESIAKHFTLTPSKVQRILKVFENEHQIEQQTSNQNRLITILHWDEYQQSEQQDEQQVNNEWTTTEQPVNTNKNDKNVKNEKNEKKDNIPQSVFEVSAYCKERKNTVDPDKWFDFYSAKGWMIGKTKMKNWKAAVRTWETKEQKPTSKYREE